MTLQAAGNVTGHYVVVNGTGVIQAGADAGTVVQSLALSLVKGGWVVNAANSIILQEVRNPNGVFNSGTKSNPFKYLFDYDPLASVTLDAGQGVTISGVQLPRTAGAAEGLIFPPNLTINAGAGGVILGTSLSLFPSPDGSLDITTTDGGNLESSIAGYGRNIVVSDSSSAQWKNTSSFTFSDMGGNVLHLDDPNPVLVNVTGSVSDIWLYSPKPVDMDVTGNIINSSVSSQNFHATDNTVISAGGQITDRDSYTFVTLPAGETPNFSALSGALAEDFISTYDATTKTWTVGYDGFMEPAIESALLAMASPFVDATTVEQLYKLSQDVPQTPIPAYQVAGTGTLKIHAASLDLGDSDGLTSVGFDNNPALAAYTARGADIDISVTGNINMVSTSIESQYGGNINIACGGSMDIGSSLTLGASELPRGIISLWGGNISVVADGNVEVDGSRIATYDGGNIFIESLQGNVDAGVGGSGYVNVSKAYINSEGKVNFLDDTIPGSGILATSYPELVYGQTESKVGSITVQTPEGNISASKGGIVQVNLTQGPVDEQNAVINLTAGSVSKSGKVYVGNIDAAGSGVIGVTVNLQATGDITGLVIASQDASIVSRENVNATVLSTGGISVSAGGSVTGEIAGVGNVAISGDAVSAALVGGSVSASGNLQGAAASSVGPAAGVSAASAATSSQAAKQTATADASSYEDGDGSGQGGNKKNRPLLAKSVGRVTILMP
jgi:hypothetical protein